MNPLSNATLAPLNLSSLTQGAAGMSGAKGASGSGDQFKAFLIESLQEMNGMQQAADQAIEKLATGDDVNPAEVLTAVQKADMSFRMMQQIRNKLVQAYQELQEIRI
ncbi:flagellar hook-basal body complex protein FliE [Lignipirellula cremea]|uniref:Flagellar hook-basal body complex protein FliE n=1 Tax=Lignipirellula cremea TaxID=2528010 RepID=A0A518DQ52_9BACT|nr:flagellar hook-basal body complex protein FliE [Lignipirellula cremea]QDU93975.1 flagellar hook-basal body protein FliE [Lignipirellula cremea]